MPDDTHTSLVNMLHALTGDNGAVAYMSCPITTGPRELFLASDTGFDPFTTRDVIPEQWKDAVYEPNVYTANGWAKALRSRHDIPVLNPAALGVAGWKDNASAYGDLWDTVIEEFAAYLIITPGCLLSQGARREIDTALRNHIPILDVNGMSVDELAIQNENNAIHTTYNNLWKASLFTITLPERQFLLS